MKKGLLILAVVLRLLVASFLFHPDIKTYGFQSSFLKKGVVNIYTYLTENKANLSLKDEFVYFPLTYLFLGGYQAIVSPLLGKEVDSWLSDASASSVINAQGVFKYLFLLKLPYLALDLLIGYLLFKYFKDRQKGELALGLWLFNPFTIMIIYAFSNMDIFAVTLTVLSFLFIKKQKYIVSTLLLGLASAFKLYPLLFIPFLMLAGRNLKEKLLIVFLPFGILAATIIPFWSKAFMQSAFISGLTTRIFNPAFSMGFNESIVLGIFILSILFFYGWLYDKKINLFNYWIIFLLTIFSFSHYHIAWLLWMAPFLIILVVKKPSLALFVFLLSTIAVAIPFFFEDRSMTISLFRLYTSWFDLIPTPFSIMEKIYDPYNFMSLLHSVFAGGAFLLGVNLFRNEENK